MSPTQIDLLLRLITAERKHPALQDTGTPDLSANDRGVEVNLELNGVHPRTAQSLVDAGLAEITDLPGLRGRWIFLGSSAPTCD